MSHSLNVQLMHSSVNMSNFKYRSKLVVLNGRCSPECKNIMDQTKTTSLKELQFSYLLLSLQK